MTTFQIDDMSCGHCISSITRALQALDPAITLQADLVAHRVQIEGTQLPVLALAAAIQDAGYTSVEVPAHPAAAAPGQAEGRACCGGCGCR